MTLGSGELETFYLILALAEALAPCAETICGRCDLATESLKPCWSAWYGTTNDPEQT